MSCERIEELLSRYVEGDLSGGERREVDEHVASCEACRSSLHVYQELEASLVSLRDGRPSPARAAAAVSGRLGLRSRVGLRWTRPWIPALTGAAFIGVGTAWFVLRGAISSVFARIDAGSSTFYSHAVSEMTAGMASGVARFAGTGEWVLLSVYLGIFALVMLAGSWMVLRFVRG